MRYERFRAIVPAGGEYVKNDPAIPEVLTAAQAARYLQLNIDTLKRELRAGRIPGNKLGRSWRLHKAALDAMLTEYACGSRDGRAEGR
jgi:excisionase family DNA binding protein